MTFQEWINELFGCAMDLCDLTEEDEITLFIQYEMEMEEAEK